MNARKYCQSHKRTGYISALNGIELYGFEYGATDYCYCISNAWRGEKRYHKLKVYRSETDIYIKIDGNCYSFNDAVSERQ